jgi:molybdopterin molybdotransferase
LLAALAGQRPPRLHRARLAGEHASDERHTRLVPVRWDGDQVLPLERARPGYLGPAALADALAVVTPGSPNDAMVEVLALP